MGRGRPKLKPHESRRDAIEKFMVNIRHQDGHVYYDGPQLFKAGEYFESQNPKLIYWFIKRERWPGRYLQVKCGSKYCIHPEHQRFLIRSQFIRKDKSPDKIWTDYLAYPDMNKAEYARTMRVSRQYINNVLRKKENEARIQKDPRPRVPRQRKGSVERAGGDDNS